MIQAASQRSLPHMTRGSIKITFETTTLIKQTKQDPSPGGFIKEDK